MRRFTNIGAALAIAAVTGLIPLNTARAAQQDDETAESALGEPEWLAWCLRDADTSLGDASCYGKYRDGLADVHSTLMFQIANRLSGSGPEGSDYAKAGASLMAAEEHWDAFIRADCDVVSYVFGQGTALGMAGQTCLIAHYETRIANLRELMASYLD